MPESRRTHYVHANYRIPAGMLLGLLLGVSAGFWFVRGQERFVTFYTAGAIGLFSGFWAGLGWHLKSRAHERPYAMMIILGLAAHLLAYSAYLNLSMHVGGTAVFDELRALDPARIDKIFIMRQYRTDSIAIIEKRRAITEFARACRTIRPYIPMPDYAPRIIFSCYVDLGDAFSHVLYIHFFHNEEDRLMGVFASRRGETETYRGAFVSRELRLWFDTYIEVP